VRLLPVKTSPYEATQSIYQEPNGPLAIACLDDVQRCLNCDWYDKTERTLNARKTILQYFNRVIESVKSQFNARGQNV
jgi:hypothetical protein